MKKGMIYVFWCVLLVFSVFGAGGTYDGNSAVLSGSIVSVDPYPVEPGQDFNVLFRVNNDGHDWAENIYVAIQENEAYALTGKDDGLDKPFNLCSACSKDSHYYFTADPDAKSGEYPIIAKLIDNGVEADYTSFIRIVGKPDIIFEADVIDEDIIPGSSFDLSLILKNVGTGIARNIKIVPVSDVFIMENENEVFLSELESGSINKNLLRFFVSDSIESGSIKLRLSITYDDEKSDSYVRDTDVGIEVKDEVTLDLSSVVFSPKLLEMNEEVELAVRVENLGEGDAENIKVFIEDLKQNWKETAYIGKLKEDEDSPVYFTLRTEFPGESNLSIMVSYWDDMGEHEVIENVPIKIYSTKSMADVIIFVFGCCVLLVFGAMLFKKRKNH